MRLGNLRYAAVRLGELLPYIGIVVVTIAFFVTIGLGQLGLGIKGLYLAIPIIIASVWLIRRKSLSEVTAEEDAPSVALSSPRFKQLTLLNALIFIVSIILLLVSETRPVGYFILMAVFAGIVFVQILGITNGSGWQKAIILGELVLLALNLIWSVTLKYPLYIGATDIPFHLYFIDSILQSSHVTDAMGSYQYFPLYHTFLASGVEVLGVNLRDGFFILAALAYVPTILFAYLIFKSITKSARLSLIACFLFSVSAEFIYYGGYMVTRSLAFVFFMVILYLLFRQPRSIGFIAVLALFSATIILTHQTTLAYISVILALFVGFQWLMARPQSNPGSQIKFTSIYLAIFVAAFVSYWLLGTKGYVEEAATSIEVAELVSPPGGVALASVLEGFASVKNHIADMLFLFFAWLGFAYLLRRASDKKYAIYTAIGLLGLVFLIIYLLNPIHLLPLMTSVFLVYRVPLLLTVFMSLAMAYGIVVLAKSFESSKARLEKKAVIPVIMVMMVAFSFFSITCVKNASDVPELRGPYFGERGYFTEAELSAFTFVQERIPSEVETPLYSDFLARRYFTDTDRPIGIIAQPDISYIKQGYLLLRTGELEARWLLFFSRPLGFSAEFYKYNLETIEPEDDIFAYLALEDRVYDNRTNQVYLISTE